MTSVRWCLSKKHPVGFAANQSKYRHACVLVLAIFHEIAKQRRECITQSLKFVTSITDGPHSVLACAIRVFHLTAICENVKPESASRSTTKSHVNHQSNKSHLSV